MRWVDGLTYKEKLRRLKEWHKWWAWYPVIVGITEDGRKIKVWLGYVWRSGEWHHGGLFDDDWKWEYKEIK